VQKASLATATVILVHGATFWQADLGEKFSKRGADQGKKRFSSGNFWRFSTGKC
jgi:hypothetical protein